MVSMMETVSCAGDDTELVTTKVSTLDYTPILVSVLLAVLIILLGYLLAFTFRGSIKEWLYRRTKTSGGNGAKSSDYNDKDRLFDVFISYSAEDREFVEQRFAPRLEHGATCYRLCLHQRDFPPTTPVFDTVSVAVESSARVLVVLTPSYIASQWNQIRSPFVSSIAANNSKVVIVKLEDVEQVEVGRLAPDLFRLLEDSPSVSWGDPGFWNKLRYLLPEPVYLTFHRNVTMRGTLQSSSNLYQAVTGISSPGAKTATHPAPPLYNLDHTYHSIDTNHIYHTLDPVGGSTNNIYLQYQPHGHNRVYTNSPLHSLQCLSPSFQSALPGTSTPTPTPTNHTHTQSVSSGKRLLGVEDSEYIV